MKFGISRLSQADDLASAEGLLIRFFREEAFTTPEDVIRRHCRRLVEIDNCALFLARRGVDPVGVATVSMQFGIEFGWIGEMGDLYVLPEMRGQGVARALITAVENFLIASGAVGYQITLTPHSRDIRSLEKFYSHLGFVREGREILYRRLSAPVP